MIRISDNFQIGKAGEHLVCADLLLKGFNVSLAGEALPYDLLLDTGKKILKVQVKTTETYRKTNQWRGVNGAYVFSIKRKGANSKKIYGNNEVDIFAVVTLDTMQIGYIKNTDMPTTINIRVDKLRGQYHDEQGIIKQEKAKELQSKGLTVKETCKELNMSETSVRNYLKKDFKPFISKAKYMSDLNRGSEWFLKL